ncbi:hypothetical protein [Nitrosomonas sp.]|uniref:hypothetical protein n=1 Tax=Nitrosomonas sp. TaxID=42353 RepID=UPI0020899A11|nr:hypothetical protein [Nitrosomonas sp.]GJL76925.1 MAG: hypothetical protein NMNS02_30310 [Nitrosomonas sp.]
MFSDSARQISGYAGVKTAIGTFQDINRPIHTIAKAAFYPVDIEIVGIKAYRMIMFHNQPPREFAPVLDSLGTFQIWPNYFSAVFLNLVESVDFHAAAAFTTK